MSEPLPEPTRADEVRSLVTLLDAVLAAVVAGYTASAVTLPNRRYWTVSTPVVDCEQVVVSLIQHYIGTPGDEAATPQRCSAPRSAVLNVGVSRCAPAPGPRGQAPTADAIQAAAEMQAIDAWLLLDIASTFDTWGFGVIATVDTTEPQGGYQTTNLTVTVAVP